MELSLIIFLTVNFLTNLMVVRNLRSKRLNWVEIPATVETFEGCDCASKITELFLPLLKEENQVPVKAVDESHKAWINRTEEPTVAPPSPHKPPPIPGPLERPAGFAL